MRYGDVIGYVYQADVWCTSCVVAEVIKDTRKELYRPNEHTGSYLPLDEIAHRLHINMDEPETYDTDDFPKAILYGQDGCDDDSCNNCHERLVEE